MKNEIHRHLDGEIPSDALADEDRAFVDDWDRLVSSFRQAAPSGGAPPWLEQRVMTEIEKLPARSALRRFFDWLLNPAPIRVSPLTAGIVAAGLTAAILLPGRRAPTDPVSVPSGGAVDIVYVQFLLEAPSATSVDVAGDFTDWQPTFALDDADGDGVWSGRVPIAPGVHGYMFLIDGTEWTTDPNAGRYQDDGFGNRNAVLAVGASG